MSIRITCIRKDNGDHENPYVAISRLSWVNEVDSKTGDSSRIEIYKWIKGDRGYAYVKDGAGNLAKLITAETQKGTQYVKTVPDDVKSDNLLKLPECKGVY